MKPSAIRVRFAPAPTGMMHIGNVRTALLNSIFARQKRGSCILRIEDTDLERNFDPGAHGILSDLDWLGITFDEGPGVGGDFGPYFQSQRFDIYQEKLYDLIEKNVVYRCFCTIEELEKKRARQIALKQPPRYDRTCLKRNNQEIEELLTQKTSFIWRFKLNDEEKVEIIDLAKGNIVFDYTNFADFPITRSDGSVTFIFANAVDDMLMEISHIFRGEDHLSNTALQAAIFKSFGVKLPIYWHMPILCNMEGRKLSKRDNGFSLRDLINLGYLPEAIDNYLAILGQSFSEEILDIQQLIEKTDFEHISKSSTITYDPKKLEWINHTWIAKKTAQELLPRVHPLLTKKYGVVAEKITTADLIQKIEYIKAELKILTDAYQFFDFYFKRPELNRASFSFLSESATKTIPQIVDTENLVNHTEETLKTLKKENKVSMQDLYHFLRFCLMGQLKGPSIPELIAFLGNIEAKQRINDGVKILTNTI